MWSNYFNWKLNTVEDWLYFLSLALATAFVLFVIYFIYEFQRKENVTKRRVARRLKRYSSRGSKIYTNVLFGYEDQSYLLDHLVIADYGVIIVKTYNWGTSVYGENRSETWKIESQKRTEVVPNPILSLEDHEIQLFKQMLADHQFYNVDVEPMIVFADTFETPTLYLGRTGYAVVFKNIKPFLQERKSQSPTVEDMDGLISLVEAHITKRTK